MGHGLSGGRLRGPRANGPMPVVAGEGGGGPTQPVAINTLPDVTATDVDVDWALLFVYNRLYRCCTIMTIRGRCVQ